MPTLTQLLRGLAPACLLLVPLGAQNASSALEERFARLEAHLARLEARLGETVSADELAPTLKEFSDLERQLGYDGKTPLVVTRAAGKETRLSVGGYVQANAEFGRAPDSRFTGIFNRVLLRRARLTLKGSFAEGFEFTLQPDFGNNSIAGVSGYRAQLADMFLAWTKYDAANIQVGQFKTPFGYEQLLADTKVLTTERSLPNDSLTVSRQIGVGLSGSFLGKRLAYSVGAFNGNGVNNGANDNDQFMYAGRLSAVMLTAPGVRLTSGVNGFWTRDTSTVTTRRTGSGVDTQLTLGPTDWAVEYLRVLQNRVTGADINGRGWSAQGAWFFVPKTWQALVRYETYDANTVLPANVSTNWVYGLTWCFNGNDLKLTFNYTVGNPAGPLQHEGRISTRLQVVF